jgi:hypothetical protein
MMVMMVTMLMESRGDYGDNDLLRFNVDDDDDDDHDG